MIFDLETIRESKCPNLWHDLLLAGRLDGGILLVPDIVAGGILSRCVDPPATTLRAHGFKATLRAPEQKTRLRAICGSCEHNVGGLCHGSTCCGGRVPVEVLLNLTTTTCPKGMWPAN
jgi:hypothetical protein